MKAEVDADIPGVADARLAGWRVGSSETAAETSSASSEGESPESGEPGCGDVVEVSRVLSSQRSSAVWQKVHFYLDGVCFAS